MLISKEMSKLDTIRLLMKKHSYIVVLTLIFLSISEKCLLIKRKLEVNYNLVLPRGWAEGGG